MVPESSLHEGRNSIELYEVVGGKLRLLGRELAVFTFPRRARRTARAAGAGGRARSAVVAVGHGGAGARERRRAPPAGGDRRLRRVPGRHPDRPRRPHRRRALPELRGARAAPRPGSATGRRSTTRPSRRCRRSSTRACRGAGTAPDVRSHQPSIFHLMDRLGYDVIKVESGTALCPPRICPGGAHAAAGRAQAAGRRRPAGAAAQVDRGDPRPAAADLLLPARAAAARALDLPAVGAPEPPVRQRPDRGHQPRRRASTTRARPTTTTCATCSRSATSTASSA